MPKPNTHLCSPFSLQGRKIHYTFSFEFFFLLVPEVSTNRTGNPAYILLAILEQMFIYRTHQPGTSLAKLKHILRSFTSSQKLWDLSCPVSLLKTLILGRQHGNYPVFQLNTHASKNEARESRSEMQAHRYFR